MTKIKTRKSNHELYSQFTDVFILHPYLVDTTLQGEFKFRGKWKI